MKLEESIANINKNGEKSIVLVLPDENTKFLDALIECQLDEVPADTIVSVLTVLAGECCEGDYIVTTDESDDHDLDRIEDVINWHEWEDKPTREELSVILKHFRPFLVKRTVTWG